jgi:hypothetical protein
MFLKLIYIFMDDRGFGINVHLIYLLLIIYLFWDEWGFGIKVHVISMLLTIYLFWLLDGYLGVRPSVYEMYLNAKSEFRSLVLDIKHTFPLFSALVAFIYKYIYKYKDDWLLLFYVIFIVLCWYQWLIMVNSIINFKITITLSSSDIMSLKLIYISMGRFVKWLADISIIIIIVLLWLLDAYISNSWYEMYLNKRSKFRKLVQNIKDRFPFFSALAVFIYKFIYKYKDLWLALFYVIFIVFFFYQFFVMCYIIII